MKKKWLSVLCTVLVGTMLTACGADTPATSVAETETVASTSTMSEEDVLKLGQINLSVGADIDALKKDFQASKGGARDYGTGDVVFDNASYVLIYNPLIYTDSNAHALSTGYLGGQILTGLNRAGGLDEDQEALFNTTSQGELLKVPVDTENLDIKAGGLDPVYKKGDTHTFYYGITNSRKSGTFTCEYAGEYCYVWSLNNSISAADAKENGEHFDKMVYEQITGSYGEAHFTENGGKINLLTYPMQGSTLGFFWPAELDPVNTYSPDTLKRYGVNTGHAILHIASNYNLDVQKGVYPHELQHLIAYSNTLYSGTSIEMDLWINEGMSANAETVIDLYEPDANCQRTYCYYASPANRYGQSLYNFELDDMAGCYGTVYLFQEYLKDVAGQKVFKDFHSQWRNNGAYSKTTTQELANVLPSNVKSVIGNKYTYSSAMESAIGSSDEVMMSKLNLDFLIANIVGTTGRIDYYEKYLGIRGQHLSKDEWMTFFRTLKLYDEINAVNVEGGGAVFVALKNGSYAIPNDADNGLVYVAFDKNFKMIGTSLAGQSGSSSGSTGSTYNENAELKTPGADDFLWNGEFSYAIVSKFNAAKYAKENMLLGMTNTWDSCGLTSLDRVSHSGDGSTADQVKSLLKKELPGVLMVQYDPKYKSKDLEAELAKAYANGVCVITFGSGSIDESTLTWNIHFDTDNMIGAGNQYDTATGYDSEMQENGYIVVQFAIDTIAGNKCHYLLSCQ